MNGFNWLDIVILLLMGSLALRGFWRGLVREILDLVGIFLAFWLTYRYAYQAGEGIADFFGWSSLNPRLVWLLGFGAILLGIGLLLTLVNGLWEAVAFEPLSLFNHLGGGGIGLLKGGIVAALFLLFLQVLPFPPLAESIQHSRLAPVLQEVTRQIYEVMEEKWPSDFPPLPPVNPQPRSPSRVEVITAEKL